MDEGKRKLKRKLALILAATVAIIGSTLDEDEEDADSLLLRVEPLMFVVTCSQSELMTEKQANLGLAVRVRKLFDLAWLAV